MGDAKRKKTATFRFIGQHPFCALCGGVVRATTREHIPPTSLFDDSHRPNEIIVPACDGCNRGTSTADLITSIISRWNYDSNQQEVADHARLVKRLRVQCPEAIAEWTKLGFIERKKAKQHLQAHGVDVPFGAGVTSIGKTTIPYLNLFCYKLTLGLHFRHLGAPLLNSGRVSATWRRKEDFVRLGLPKEILDMLPRYSTLRQGTWNTSSEFEYRYDANGTDRIFGCFARLRACLRSGFPRRLWRDSSDVGLIRRPTRWHAGSVVDAATRPT